MKDLIDLDPAADGLGGMLADLIAANLERDPVRIALITRGEGAVNLDVTDAEVTVGLRFDGGRLAIGVPAPLPDLAIATDAGTLMELTSVPLRFGMPDSLRPEGRRIAQKLLKGEIKVKGLPRGLPLMIRLNKLFTVA